MLGLRLGDKPQAIVTTTPRPSKIIKALAAGKDTIVTRGSTFDNKAHLARAFFERITARYKGRAIGRQELFAEIVEETPGALWTRALLERQRVAPEAAPKEFAEIVVAVDPPARSGSKSDECGLIVAAKAENGLFYVLADLTSQGETPGAWGARVGAAFRNFKANRVVAEINQGGDMVTEVLRQSEPNLPVRAVHATRGKFLRAEPIAAAYERGLVFHVGTFVKLEDQLCALTPDFDRRAMGFSPDRADALVWALADLLGVGRGSTGGMYRVLDCRQPRICGSTDRIARQRLSPGLQLPGGDGMQRRAELAVELFSLELGVDGFRLVLAGLRALGVRARRARPFEHRLERAFELDPAALGGEHVGDPDVSAALRRSDAEGPLRLSMSARRQQNGNREQRYRNAHRTSSSARVTARGRW